ncbi:MAG: copper chaperone PCu(A)C [Rhodobacteraceae bacterium]|nr:MAG: copper chaperone PCu(A)C [Paracoccaceae bacterium]
MSFKTTLLAAASAALLAGAAFADGIMVKDPYARSSGPTAVAGAAFMELMNPGTEDDRLIAARSDIAERVELHTHLQDANGVMRMVEIEDGIAVPAGGSALLARGGDHVMFIGLKQPLNQGDEIAVTLVFEKAGEVAVTIPVDLERKPMGHGHMKQGG